MKRKTLLNVAIVLSMVVVACSSLGRAAQGNNTSLVFDGYGDYKILEFNGVNGNPLSFNMNWTDQASRINMFVFNHDYNVLTWFRTERGTCVRTYESSTPIYEDGIYYIFLFRSYPAATSLTVQVGSNYLLSELGTASGLFTCINMVNDCRYYDSNGMDAGYALHFDESLINHVSRNLDIFLLNAGGADPITGEINLDLVNNVGSTMSGSSGMAQYGAGIRYLIYPTDGSEAHVIVRGDVCWDPESYIVLSNTELFPGTNFATPEGQIPQEVGGFDLTWFFMSIAVAAILVVVKGRKRASITGR
jgi:hypothetical protein